MNKSPKPYEKAFEEAREGFRALSLEKRVQRLKKYGILDKSGELAKHYRREPKAKSS